MSDRHGFYTVDGVKFETKIKALIHVNDKPDKIVKWNFNDEVFSQYDWSVEPQESLDELYDLRTRQIREKYDYVILSYSGGSDSNNILESFIRQGLHIDEIVTTWPYKLNERHLDLSGYNKNASNNAAEFSLNTKHRLQYIQTVYPKTKITYNDISEFYLNFVGTKKDDDWLEQRHDSLNLTGMTNWNLTNFKHHRETFDKSHRVAVIYGVDKPILNIKEKKLFFFFVDKTANAIHFREMELMYPNVDVLYYYWDAESVKIMIKQSHTIMKYLKIYPKMQELWNTTSIELVNIKQELMKFLIYPTTWNKNYWQVEKIKGDWNCELDRVFMTEYRDTKAFMRWKKSISELAPKISNFLMFDKDTVRGITPFTSKFYYIGTL